MIITLSNLCYPIKLEFTKVSGFRRIPAVAGGPDYLGLLTAPGRLHSVKTFG